MKKVLLSLLVVLAFSISAVAQNRTVTGKVLDASGKAVEGATVSTTDGKVNAKTIADGTYSITVPSGTKRLSVSSVNSELSTVNIGDASLIVLSEKTGSLDEVVVVGYQVKKKREANGAVSSVKGKEIQNLPNVSVDRALQGRAAGVLVQGNNGIPGGAININIRGNAGFGTNTQPLYVVDGVQINNRIDGGITQNNPLAFLNTNDIESIDVLKDAASAAIYGAQAANGVVLVTTKKGKNGKAKVTANITGGFTNILKKFDVLNSTEYVNARSEADFARFAPTGGSGYTFLVSQRYALGELSSYTGVPYEIRNSSNALIGGTTFYSQKQVDSAIAALPNTDWQDAAIQTGINKGADLSVSGGNDKTTFFISGNYTNQTAAFKKVDFTRYGLSLDVSHKFNSKIDVNTNLKVSSFDQKAPFATDGSFLGNPAFSSSLIVPANPIYRPDGNYFGLPGNGEALAGALNQNVVAVNDYNKASQRTNQAVGTFALGYQILKWLKYRGTANLDYRIVQSDSYRDPRTNDAFAVRGRGSVASNWNTNVLTNHVFYVDKQLSKQFKLNAIAGYEFRRDFNEGISAQAIGFPSSDFATINAAATPEATGGFYTGYKRTSIFGKTTVGFTDKYSLELTLRRDGSSRFGANNKFGTFWGVLVGWNLDKEKFLKGSNTISQLRLRASVGEVGDDGIGNFDALALYGAGAQYNGNAGINYGSISNPNLKWQRNNTVNLGLDYGLFKNRVTGSIEVYERLTKDALLSKPLTWLNGVGSYAENIGEISIKGVEVSTNVDIVKPKRQGGFGWSVNANFSFQYNTIKKLYDGLEVLPSDPSVRVGRSNSSIFTQVYKGVNPATGRPMYLDTFGNITYQPQARDRRYIGDQQPDYFGGFGSQFNYKGFTLDVLFNYEIGRLTTDGQVNFMLENGNRTFNTLRFAYENRWQKPGDITSYPRIFDTGVEPSGVNHVSASSRLWRKADFLRLRDIKLSYLLPTKMASKLHLTNLLFYVQGQNLYTLTNFWGYDPEFVGTATGIIPQTRNVSLGVQVTF
jgi:TonB-dependent starch-binding outer membrane protein SusC